MDLFVFVKSLYRDVPDVPDVNRIVKGVMSDLA